MAAMPKPRFNLCPAQNPLRPGSPATPDFGVDGVQVAAGRIKKLSLNFDYKCSNSKEVLLVDVLSRALHSPL